MKQRGMLILVDMDGTLADLESRFFEEYGRRYADEPGSQGLRARTWELTDQLGPGRAHLVDEILGASGFFAGLAPLPGGIEAVHAMRDAGHEVMLCTSAFKGSRWCESEKRHWVEEHLGRELVRSMVITSDKTVVRGDVLIDDKPEITGRTRPLWRQVLLDQAYNAHVALPRIARDWSDWRQVLASL